MAVSLKSVNNNLRKLLLCGVSAACFISLPAYADNVYLLQLGSFDSKAQAEQKWQDLKSQNSDILSSVQPHITEVSMGDDNKTSYRTEAGPVNSKDAATKLCSQLQAKGAECNVVETALYTSDEAPTQATAPAAETAAAPVVTQAAEKSAPATASASSANYISGREPKFLDSDNPVTEVAAAQPPTSPAQQQAITTNTTPEPVAAPAGQPHDLIVPERAPRALNEDEVLAAREQAAPVTQTETVEEPAPVAKPAKVAVADSDDDESESPAESRRPSMFGHKHKKATEVTTSRTAEAETPSSPSPAESKNPGFFGRLFSSSPTTPAPEAKPVVVATETPSAQIATTPLPPTTPAATAPAKEIQGNVSVAEAVRVPLTDETARKPVVVTEAPQHPVTRQILTVGGMYWAQINYFADEQQAHNFYEKFRSQYPEVSDGVRMSITRPYAYVGKDGHVTLKMGSFASQDDIGAICNVAAQYGLHCVSIKESAQQITMSSVPSPSPNLPHEHIMAETSVDKTPAPSGGFLAPQTAEVSSYWVQLGSFDSPDDAWDKWRDIKRRHKKAVNKVTADVSEPDSSSAVHKLFRLRAGPYGNEGLANALCNKLIKAGEDCLVVAEQK